MSNLLQELSELDPAPWRRLVGFAPTRVLREQRLHAAGSGRSLGNADVLLEGDGGQRALIEVKLGHVLSDDQRTRYTEWATSHDSPVFLLGLSTDRALVPEADPNWQFQALADVFRQWHDSSEEFTAQLADRCAATLAHWDAALTGVLGSDGEALSTIRERFLGQALTRRVGALVLERDPARVTRPSVTSGGGLPIIQAWAPLDVQGWRHVIAEMRWWKDMAGAELRFGVDYSDLPSTAAHRREAFDLATRLMSKMSRAALEAHLKSSGFPDPAQALGRHVPAKARGDWDAVIERGFRTKDNPGGVEGNRRSTRPPFAGDGTLRFEAVIALNLDRINAVDLTNLLDATLKYLVEGALDTNLERH
ncbi:hypothetical protein [Luteococcus japonicus]|uniref:hypothetical protein n=1 Tax=Luteococcus japonicus TaxID=33984 RepID=UPI0011CE2232|nr:hypothetical protein [Luteococcus japonicus]